MEWLVTGTTTTLGRSRLHPHRPPPWREGHPRPFPSFVILDPDNLRSEETVKRLAWRMIGEPGDFDICIEERVAPPCEDCDINDRLFNINQTRIRELQKALLVCLAYIQKKNANPDGFGVGTIHFTSMAGKRMKLDFSAFARTLDHHPPAASPSQPPTNLCGD